MQAEERRWLGLEATHNAHRWYLPITPGVSSGHGFLFGGAGLGAAIAALEGTSGRPLVWATAQYLSYARTGTVMDIDVTLAVEGRATTQARALGHVGGSEILTVNAALGTRSYTSDIEFVQAPEVSSPADSPVKPPWNDSESVSSRMDQRWAIPVGSSGSGPVEISPGRVGLWVRFPDMPEVSAAGLAVLGDYVPMGIGVATNHDTSGNSIDNTLRMVRREDSEWFLLDIHVTGVRDGFGHGHVNIFTETKTLLAIASQSVVVRKRRDDGGPPRRLADAPDNRRL